ncbi:MAG: RDD family protein [Nitrospirae bacterium]|nr:RDD family protein [Nitrospirota bacterium]MBI3353013.1 RDD family protein [Nitrospirota bacterium]
MGVYVDQTSALEAVFPKAVILHRVIAKGVDFLILAIFRQIFPPTGIYLSITYLLIADGLFHGKSIGKLLVGLQTFVPHKNKNASFRESIIRNFPLLIGYLFLFIPYLGWIFFFLIIGFELLLMIGNEKGLRIGDELAKTQVLDSESFEIKNL